MSAYAIIELGGRQWKVQPGSRLDVNRLDAEPGTQQTVDRVLVAHDGAQLHLGRPYVPDAKVICDVLEHRRGPKVISYHYRRRENWRKTVGHRQSLTRLVVKDIQLGAPAQGQESAAQTAKPPAAAKARTAAATRPAAKPRASTAKQPGTSAKPLPTRRPASTKQE